MFSKPNRQKSKTATRRRLAVEPLEDRCLLAAGLTGAYFDNADLTGLKLTRTDAAIDFAWDAASPDASLGADTFSVRWSGQVQPLYSEPYTFHVTADDGFRLWVDRHLIVGRWTDSTARESSGRIVLQAGQWHELTLEYYERTGHAAVRLEWESPSQPRQVIPAERLSSAGEAADRGTILQETWTGIAASTPAGLAADPDYPDRPAARDYLLTLESLQADVGDNYGRRIHGYLVPPLTGDYVLAVAGDDQAELYLSLDQDPSHKVLIAAAASPTGPREFDTFASQRSTPQPLVAGQRYYIEVLQTESTGADHFSVGWQLPASVQTVVIPGEYLAPYAADSTLPSQGSILATLTSAHPRLLAPAERWEWLRQQIGSAGQMQNWYNALRASADSLLTAALPVYTPDNRGTILGISRSVVDRMYKLALAYRISGDTRYAERAWENLQAAAAFPDWHPAHFLDTAEMTHAFALGYDWFYDYWTPARRGELVTALVDKGLNPGLSVLRSNGWWSASTSNNWNLVCNGGLVLGALAIADQQPALAAEVLARAVPSVQAILRHFTADNGGWYEGPGYWGYSTEYQSRMAAALVSALGTDFGLSQTEGLSETGFFPLQMLGPSRLGFNFADASAGVIRGPQLFWYARRYGRPEYAWFERTNGAASVMGLLWYDSRGSDPASRLEPPEDQFRGDTAAYATQDVVTLRGSWADPQTTFAGFKAGRVGDSHGNLDAGSFVLDALGQRWIHDLGGDDYALPGYFGSQRWDYYRMRAEGHNTLVINPGAGADQIVGGQPVLVHHEATADESLSIADLTPAYSGVTRVWRGLRLNRWDGSLLVQDEIEAAAAAEVWSFFHVKLDPSQIEISADGSEALLTTTKGRLWARLLGSPGAQWQLQDPQPLPTSPDPAGQNTNAGFQKLAIHLPHVTSRRVAVWFVPLAPGQSPPLTMPEIGPLSQWRPASDHRRWLGDVDGYVAGDGVDLGAADAAWQAEVAAVSGLPPADLDEVSEGQVVPLSLAFTIPPGQQVTRARLTLGLRGTGGSTSSERLYLERAEDGALFDQLGWSALTTSPSARVLDLRDDLALLQDGRLDVAVAGNVAVDWAELDLAFGPTGLYTLHTLYPEADAYVRSGSYADQNYASGTLGVKKDSGDYGREAYIRFALADVPAEVSSATLRLVPTSLAAPAENQLAFVAADDWSETGLTWNNRPAAETPFASFQPVLNQAAEFDVTSLVAQAVAGDRRLSLRISSSVAGADFWTYFGSRESSNPQLRPQLIITSRSSSNDSILRIDGDQDQPDQNDTIRLVGDSGYLNVFLNGGRWPLYRRDVSTLDQILVDGLGGDDTLEVDFSAGSPLPSGGLSFSGGGGQDTIRLSGAGSAEFLGDRIVYGPWTIGLTDTEYAAFATADVLVRGATLRIGRDDALTSLTKVIVAEGGLLDLNGHTTAAGTVTLVEGTIAGGTLIGSAYTLQNGTVSGSLGGSGRLTKNTSGRVVLSGANTYSGATLIYEGTLTVQHPQALGTGNELVTVSADGATNRYAMLEFDGPDFTIEERRLQTTGAGIGGQGAVRNLGGQHTWTGPVTLTGGGGWSTYQSDAGLLRFTGPIAPNTTGRGITLQGAGDGEIAGGISDGGQSTALAIRKRGSGSWTLAAENTYTGTTTIEAGILLLTGTLAGGAITVNSGATLGGVGTAAGIVTVSAGGSVAPAGRGSAGVLTVGSLTLASGSQLDYDFVDGSLDRLAVTGSTVIQGGRLNIAGTEVQPGTYAVIDYAGTLGGSAADLATGVRPDGFRWQLSDNPLNTAIELTVTNSVPHISSIADQQILQDTLLAGLTFQISDLETAASLITVTATSANSTLLPAENITLGWGPWSTGEISRSYWQNVSGSSVSNLRALPAFPDDPHGAGVLTSFEAPGSWGDSYGQLVHGYIVPPQTGNYVFWIASDDRSELWLSPDGNPAGKTKIAEVTGYTSSRQWTKEPSQQSAAVPLEAGRAYYIEAVHKEGSGGDHLAVGWQLPDGSLERPIPGLRLTPADAPAPRTLAILPAAGQSGTTTITLTARDSGGASASTSFQLVVQPAARVAGRHVFYNESHFDGSEAEASAADDNAIASDKTALLPGGTATRANYTSYSRGINGIMVDIENLADPELLLAGQFEFRVGNSSTPGDWELGPMPASVAVRQGAGSGGSDRVTLIWPEGAMRNQWLQVTVRADAVTGLALPDVFYFGNAVGEAGNSSANAFVDGTDFAGPRDHPRNFQAPAPLDMPYDYNRDSFVDGLDLAIARDHSTDFLTALRLISLPLVAAFRS